MSMHELLESRAALQQMVTTMAEDISRSSMPLLERLTKNAVYPRDANLWSFSDDYGTHSAPFELLAFHGCLTSRHELLVGESHAEAARFIEKRLKDSVVLALKGIESYFVRTICDAMPAMRQERVSAIDNATLADFGMMAQMFDFCLTADKFDPESFRLRREFVLVPVFPGPVPFATVLFAPGQNPLFCAFQGRMLWPEVSLDLLTGNYRLSLDCHVAAAPRNVPKWLALTNETWLIQRAEHVMEQAAAMA